MQGSLPNYEHDTDAMPSRAAAIYGRSGSFLVLTGIVHLAIWGWTWEPWEGPLSVRKPILFGVSTGVTLWSLAWVARRLSPSFLDLLVARLVSAALVIEVLLIQTQYWRGRASHFNKETLLDLSIMAAMGGIIVVATLGIAWVSLRTLWRFHGTSDELWAARYGMFLLLGGCLLGFLTQASGEYEIARGRPPEIYGQAGVIKFPHGIPLHAIQLLILTQWALTWLGVPTYRRTQAIRYSALGTVLLTIYALAQVYSGRARFDVAPDAELLLVASVFAFLTSLASAFTGEAKTPAGVD